MPLTQLSGLYEKEYWTVLPYQDYRYPDVQSMLVHFMERFHPKTVLDIGCSDGGFVHAFQQEGVEAAGLDISSYVLAWKRYPISVVRASMTHLPFRDNAFDLITCIGTLEHTPPDLAHELIHEWERVGTVICATAESNHDRFHLAGMQPEEWAKQCSPKWFLRGYPWLNNVEHQGNRSD